MNTVVIDDSSYKNVADIIREKTNTERGYKPSEMSEVILESWESAIYNHALDCGSRTDCRFAFRYWGAEYLRPPFVYRPTSASRECFRSNSKLKKIEKKYFDFSNCSTSDTSEVSGHYYTFDNCNNLEIFEDIGLPAGYYYYTWRYCEKLHTIECVRSHKETIYSGAFSYCYELTNVRFDGEIGQNINISSCSKLSNDSVNDIIDHLADLTGEEQKTIMWHSTVSSNLTTEQLTKIQNKNWKIG